MKGENNNLKRNDSGYMDLTAYEAVKSVLKKENNRNEEIHEAILLVKKLLKKFDLVVINRMEIKDKRTGKIHR